MTGDTLDRVLHGLSRENGGLSGDIRKGRLPYTTGCSAHSCHRCTSPDCPYADFLRQYVACPRCD